MWMWLVNFSTKRTYTVTWEPHLVVTSSFFGCLGRAAHQMKLLPLQGWHSASTWRDHTALPCHLVWSTQMFIFELLTSHSLDILNACWIKWLVVTVFIREVLQPKPRIRKLTRIPKRVDLLGCWVMCSKVVNEVRWFEVLGAHTF
jgi:hypothetical protein